MKNKRGDRYNKNKLRWRNFPMFLIEPVIEVGAAAEKHPDNPKGKYETFNFLKGLSILDTLDSLKRHLNSFESPYESDFDQESTLSHMAHVAWNALIIVHYLKTRPDLDDRYQLPEIEAVQTGYENIILEASKLINEGPLATMRITPHVCPNMHIKGNK